MRVFGGVRKRREGRNEDRGGTRRMKKIERKRREMRKMRTEEKREE